MINGSCRRRGAARDLPNLKSRTYSAGILDVLMLAAGDKSERVQRKAVAAFGELLFFISHQGPAQEVFAPVRHPGVNHTVAVRRQQGCSFSWGCTFGVNTRWRS